MLTSYLAWFYYLYYIAPGVSDPGPPRQHKIDRYPKWMNRNISFPSQIKWQYVQSKTSHIVTDYMFRGTSGFLTGDPNRLSKPLREVLVHPKPKVKVNRLMKN